jgi:hypothetical protein
VNFTSSNFEYGPVVVTRGPHKGRVGELDDDTVKGTRAYGYVYFAGFGITRNNALLPMSHFRLPNTRDLLDRHEDLWRSLTAYSSNPLAGEPRIEALQELAYVADLLNDRMFDAQFMTKHDGLSLFLSHSSIDKAFVRGLAVDLAALGHKPWLDEWEILGGESIPTKLAEGISTCELMLVVLSSASVASKWVENEWQAKHWHEVNTGQVSLVPVLMDKCEVPTLLKTKRYIDFRSDYSAALEDLARTLAGHAKQRGRGDA